MGLCEEKEGEEEEEENEGRGRATGHARRFLFTTTAYIPPLLPQLHTRSCAAAAAACHHVGGATPVCL